MGSSSHKHIEVSQTAGPWGFDLQNCTWECAQQIFIFEYTKKIKAMQIESTNISGFHPFEKKKTGFRNQAELGMKQPKIQAYSENLGIFAKDQDMILEAVNPTGSTDEYPANSMITTYSFNTNYIGKS